jgi:hypothetical protein
MKNVKIEDVKIEEGITRDDNNVKVGDVKVKRSEESELVQQASGKS